MQSKVIIVGSTRAVISSTPKSPDDAASPTSNCSEISPQISWPEMQLTLTDPYKITEGATIHLGDTDVVHMSPNAMYGGRTLNKQDEDLMDVIVSAEPVHDNGVSFPIRFEL